MIEADSDGVTFADFEHHEHPVLISITKQLILQTMDNFLQRSYMQCGRLYNLSMTS